MIYSGLVSRHKDLEVGPNRNRFLVVAHHRIARRFLLPSVESTEVVVIIEDDVQDILG